MDGFTPIRSVAVGKPAYVEKTVESNIPKETQPKAIVVESQVFLAEDKEDSKQAKMEIEVVETDIENTEDKSQSKAMYELWRSNRSNFK